MMGWVLWGVGGESRSPIDRVLRVGFDAWLRVFQWLFFAPFSFLFFIRFFCSFSFSRARLAGTFKTGDDGVRVFLRKLMDSPRTPGLHGAPFSC